MLVTEYKIQLFNKFSPSLVTTVLQLIEKERNNQSINSGLISETLQSYVYGNNFRYRCYSKSMPTKDSTASTFQKKDDSEKNASIESAKELNLEAIIVRIMKTRKEMRHQQLVSDVVGVVKKRFKPEISHVKRSIDVLIEKDYIKRDANERDLYQYIA
uniref:Cullin_Nedd8 domain-containing protein n=1 Tax=Rhabditophanes sp. KR3021 TaxID=114890 RepID=A0AC35TTA6_9BILA